MRLTVGIILKLVTNLLSVRNKNRNSWLKLYVLCQPLAILLITVLPKSGSTLNPETDPLKSTIEYGMELTINNKFDSAMALFQKLVDKHPEHPIGYFYKGATLQAKMLDWEDFSKRTEFFDYMNQAIRHADSLKTSSLNNHAWLFFYEGSAYLYRSFFKSKVGNWFSAYRDALRGVDRLERALEIDSLLYDAYLGVGSFKYWKSARADFLLWLPFISDEREQGIQMIRQSIQKGHFVRWIARDQLCWILMDDGQYEEALTIAQENHRAYPKSRFFKWTLVSAAYYNKNLKLSYKLYQELLESVRNQSYNNHYNEIVCLVNLAKISLKRKDWHSAFQFADEALRLRLSDTIRKRARSKLKRALNIRTESSEYLE